jgi:hypothetical protein
VRPGLTTLLQRRFHECSKSIAAFSHRQPAFSFLLRTGTAFGEIRCHDPLCRLELSTSRVPLPRFVHDSTGVALVPSPRLPPPRFPSRLRLTEQRRSNQLHSSRLLEPSPPRPATSKAQTSALPRLRVFVQLAFWRRSTRGSLRSLALRRRQKTLAWSAARFRQTANIAKSALALRQARQARGKRRFVECDNREARRIPGGLSSLPKYSTSITLNLKSCRRCLV